MATFRNRSTASDLPEGLRQFVVRDWVDLDDSDPLFEFVRQISAKARPLSPFVAHVIGPRRYSDAVVRLVGPILGTDPARQLAAETVRNWAASSPIASGASVRVARVQDPYGFPPCAGSLFLHCPETGSWRRQGGERLYLNMRPMNRSVLARRLCCID